MPNWKVTHIRQNNLNLFARMINFYARFFVQLVAELTIADIINIYFDLTGEKKLFSIAKNVNMLIFRNRPIFNWAHKIVGHLAFLLGIIAIILAFKFPFLKLPESLLIAFLVWKVVYVVVQVSVSSTILYINNKLWYRINTIYWFLKLVLWK